VLARRRVQEIDQATAGKREGEPAALGHLWAVGRAQHGTGQCQRLLRYRLLQSHGLYFDIERV